MATPIVLYGVAIHDAIASGDLSKMKKIREKAKAQQKPTADIAAALKALETEIAKLERRRG